MAYDDALAELTTIAVALDTSGPCVARKIDKIVIAAAHQVEAISKRIAPVDTGALRSSIGVDITRNSAGAGYSTTAEIGPTVEYGAWVEYGTTRTAPQPFMGPAADRVEPGFVAALLAAADPLEGRA